MKIFITLSLLIASLLASDMNPHNFTVDNLENNSDEACIFCHTPETTSSWNGGSNLMWNNNTTDITFKVYGLESIAAKNRQNSSLTCLGCHDGVIGPDMGNNFSILRASHTGSFQNGILGNGESKGHPVSVKYIEGKAGLISKNTQIFGFTNASKINDLLKDGRVECVSCHNPHETRWGKYLRHRNSKSEICVTCHKK